MKYPYIVVKGDKWYKAGEEVPEDKKVEEIKIPDEIIVEQPTAEVTPKTYTKTELNRMNVADLQRLAKSVGIEDAGNTSGAKLKVILNDYYRGLEA